MEVMSVVGKRSAENKTNDQAYDDQIALTITNTPRYTHTHTQTDTNILLLKYAHT